MTASFRYNAFQNQEIIAEALRRCMKEFDMLSGLDKNEVDKPALLSVRYNAVMSSAEKLSELQYVADHVSKSPDVDDHVVYIDGTTLHAVNEWTAATDEALVELYFNNFGLDVSDKLADSTESLPDATPRVLN